MLFHTSLVLKSHNSKKYIVQFITFVNFPGVEIISYMYGIVFIYSDNKNEQHNQPKNKHQTNPEIFTRSVFHFSKSFQRIVYE